MQQEIPGNPSFANDNLSFRVPHCGVVKEVTMVSSISPKFNTGSALDATERLRARRGSIG